MLVLLLSPCLGPCARSAAETHCATIAAGSEALTLIDAEARLRYIQERLRHAAWRTRIWAWTWAGAYSASAAVNLGVALGLGPSDARPDRYVAAGASLVGVAALAALPQKVMGDQRWLDRRVGRAPPGTDRCALLAEAERLLVRDAANEVFGRGPLVHAGNFLLNTGVALILTLGFHRAEQGMLAAFIGIGVGEIQIATQPVDLVEDLRRYRAGSLGAAPARRDPRWAIVPLISREQGGLLLNLAF